MPAKSLVPPGMRMLARHTSTLLLRAATGLGGTRLLEPLFDAVLSHSILIVGGWVPAVDEVFGALCDTLLCAHCASGMPKFSPQSRVPDSVLSRRLTSMRYVVEGMNEIASENTARP